MPDNYIKKILLKNYQTYFGLGKKKVIIDSIVLSLSSSALLLINFKKIRATFSPPEIDSNKLIGFSQYFGYPFYYDTFILFFLIFLPALIFFILNRIRVKK